MIWTTAPLTQDALIEMDHSHVSAYVDTPEMEDFAKVSIRPINSRDL